MKVGMYREIGLATPVKAVGNFLYRSVQQCSCVIIRYIEDDSW